MFVKASKSKIEGKKLMAIFYDANRKLIKTIIHFGATGFLDYTITHDSDMRKTYRKPSQS